MFLKDKNASLEITSQQKAGNKLDISAKILASHLDFVNVTRETLLLIGHPNEYQTCNEIRG